MSMAEDPPERGVFGRPPVLPDRTTLREVIQRTYQAGVRRSVKMRLFMIHTKKVTRDMLYERMKKTIASFFEQKEMEMTLFGCHDEGQKLHTMRDFPANLAELSRMAYVQRDDDGMYDIYLKADVNYTPSKMFRRYGSIRDVQRETRCQLHVFKLTPKLRVEAGYLMFLHPKVTHLAARTAEIEDYIRKQCPDEGDVTVELTSREKKFGFAEKISTHVVKVRFHREKVNLVSNVILAMISRGYLPPRAEFLPQKLGKLTENAYRNCLQEHTLYVEKLKYQSVYDIDSEDLYDYLSTKTNGKTNLKHLYDKGLVALESSFKSGKYHFVAGDTATVNSLIHGEIIPTLKRYGLPVLPTLARSPLADEEYNLSSDFITRFSTTYDVDPQPVVTPTTLRKNSYASVARRAISPTPQSAKVANVVPSSKATTPVVTTPAQQQVVSSPRPQEVASKAPRDPLLIKLANDLDAFLSLPHSSPTEDQEKVRKDVIGLRKDITELREKFDSVTNSPSRDDEQWATVRADLQDMKVRFASDTIFAAVQQEVQNLKGAFHAKDDKIEEFQSLQRDVQDIKAHAAPSESLLSVELEAMVDAKMAELKREVMMHW